MPLKDRQQLKVVFAGILSLSSIEFRTLVKEEKKNPRRIRYYTRLTGFALELQVIPL